MREGRSAPDDRHVQTAVSGCAEAPLAGGPGGYGGAMTTPPPDPPLAGDELVAAGTEREVLKRSLTSTARCSSGRSPESLSRTPGIAACHMIEETARHVGHADILREQTDGATGVDG
jgi:hypothetical protein